MDPERARKLVDAFDPGHLPPTFYADPYPTYAALRELAPVRRCADGSYFLTRYAHLEQVYRDRSHFSSDKRAVFAPKFGAGTPLYQHHTTSLVFNDAPYHTRVRRPIVAALTPQVLRAMEPQVTELIERLLRQLQERGHVDLIEDFAAAIPVEVIGNLLRVPHAERGPLRAWSLAILGALEQALTPAQLSTGHEAVREFTAYLRQLIAERRRNPAGEADLLTRLLRDEELREEELLQNCVFLLNAGHETTTNLIGSALWLLLNAPHEAQRLRADPSLVPAAVEECLRMESPNQLGNRLVTAAVEVGGMTLEAGSYLTLCIGAANRDPEEFPDPDRFEATRKPNRHLAFAAGAHACAGMNVARLEAQIAIERTLQRLPELRLTGEPVRSHRARFRGFVHLPAQAG
jgi:cytochrome P450